ncbi:DUF6259 domain-containing protein [Neobacillus cucumis]|uniref:DUF6259 domain-containing protein n=1 Tax=Neobacillus cucumis TaxID=1740721 RepID=A0A2N5H6B2_9BACI|nr:DUF6259 domain-containing protein [Neobacillus cucumis]PLS01052.1 hypothetical protein CVD27_27040 [Neobacillus cucumis]
MYTIGYDFGDTLIQLGDLQFAIRLFTEVNAYAPDPGKLVLVEDQDIAYLKADGLIWAGGQQTAKGSIEAKISRGADGRYIVEARGVHESERCKSVLLQVFGINVLKLNTDEGKVEELNPVRCIKAKHYPSNIKMPLAFIEDQLGQGWFALSKDHKLRDKGFASHYDPYLQCQVLDLSHEEDKRFQTNEIIMPAWHIGSYSEKNAVIKERCLDLEQNFGLVPFEQRKDTPEWLKDIKLVTIFHAEHWTGHVFNTFAEMEEKLKWVTGRIDGKEVLAFIPGWDGRYYYNYPEYEPSPFLGGKEGFKSFVETAHRLGVKVVPMLGANNANIEVMKKLGLEDAAAKDQWGLEKRCDWVDWDYDLSTENNCMLANMGHPGYLEHMIERSKYLVNEYGVDGIFLDISIFWTNDPNYSPYEGTVAWAKAMKEAFPHLLLFGENSYDALWGVFSIFHEMGRPAGHGHALYRYARQTYYLAAAAPGLGSGGIHEYAWNSNGLPWERDFPELVPTLSVVGDTMTTYEKATELIVKKAKGWKPIHPGIS